MDASNFIQVFKRLCDKVTILKSCIEIIKCANNDTECLYLLKELEYKISSVKKHLQELSDMLTVQRELCEELKKTKIEVGIELYKLNRLEELVQENEENNSNSENKENNIDLENKENDSSNLENNGMNLLVDQASSLTLLECNFPSLNSHCVDCSPISVDSATRLKPKCIEFGISYLTEEEFKLLPKYMCGRLTIKCINEFVDIINHVVFKKYNILSQSKSSLKTSNLFLYNSFKFQEIPQLKGKHFITEEDIARECQKKMLDKKTINFLTILRHCKRLTRQMFNGKVYLITN